MSVSPINTPELSQLKSEIEAHRRLCGYYLIRVLDISELQRSIHNRDELLLDVFRALDDRQPSWDHSTESESEWIVDREEARSETVQALMAGPNFGHIDYTIGRVDAEGYFDRFDDLFEFPKKYYTRLVFGDTEYVFTRGVVIVSPSRAGILWVVEGD